MDRLYNKEFITAACLGVGVGFFIGWISRGRVLGGRSPSTQPSRNGQESCDLSGNNMLSDTGEYKLIVVVRTDLKMGKGKIAAQVAHAAVQAYNSCAKNQPDMLKEWKYSGQPKVVVKIDSETSLLAIASKAKTLGLNASVIRDAGRTQIPGGSVTVCGVGPGPNDLVSSVTGHLKLL
ncbi:peptidyl-tRNA hydrolase 2, mitochondrial-like [Mizuhopecten yessoensis]|uniref:peptidyl-tRNA hydrolase n=1 Tax=Mizuhopecten yessoensis TaxID=6573 RepID=A0A210PQP3_MIZYE|nr:peptidyl-tRNA hydrolase 2, mitochondrial-like [Mizuhopecten yessoensis]OWF38807.1 Peptidyl-tRNA hydrolase 2, mitochondrial [Mizuhopecten yessoensis]